MSRTVESWLRSWSSAQLSVCFDSVCICPATKSPWFEPPRPSHQHIQRDLATAAALLVSVERVLGRFPPIIHFVEVSRHDTCACLSPLRPNIESSRSRLLPRRSMMPRKHDGQVWRQCGLECHLLWLVAEAEVRRCPGRLRAARQEE